MQDYSLIYRLLKASNSHISSTVSCLSLRFEHFLLQTLTIKIKLPIPMHSEKILAKKQKPKTKQQTLPLKDLLRIHMVLFVESIIGMSINSIHHLKPTVEQEERENRLILLTLVI